MSRAASAGKVAKRAPADQRKKLPAIGAALDFIERLATHPALTRRQRSYIQQAAQYLRAIDGGGGSDTNLLTPQQVAKRFHVHPVTVRQWAHQGRIESICTPGGHRRFALAAVERFARKHRC